MAVRLGLGAKLYRNTGTFAAPVWNEVKNVKAVNLNLEAIEADVTTRQRPLACHGRRAQGRFHRVREGPGHGP
jgi:hypothetical protein